MIATRLVPVISATWPPGPPGSVARVGPFLVPGPDPGGNRVSAARLAEPGDRGAAPGETEAAEHAMRAQGRAPLFQVFDHQDDLGRDLDARGYLTRDATDILLAESGALAAQPPPVTAFDIWPPLAIQTEIWEGGGIDAARRAVMDRAAGPKTSLLGRISDRPAGSAFVAVHDGIAMLHALEIVPSCRRLGLAGHMMRAAALWARTNGADSISVLVTRRNLAAQGLYAALGMTRAGGYAYRERQGGGGR